MPSGNGASSMLSARPVDPASMNCCKLTNFDPTVEPEPEVFWSTSVVALE